MYKTWQVYLDIVDHSIPSPKMLKEVEATAYCVYSRLNSDQNSLSIAGFSSDLWCFVLRP